MVNCHNLLAYMCELYEHEQLPLLLIADIHGKEKAVKTVFAQRCMMIAISARMIHDLQY